MMTSNAHDCIKNAPNDERCMNCPEYHCKNDEEYCMVIEDIRDEKVVLRCPDCGTFRRRTESDHMNAMNPGYEIVCRECGTTWDYSDMLVKIDPEEI